MSEHTDRAVEEQPFVWPTVRKVAPGAPWRWIALGLADMKVAPGASLFYGVVFDVSRHRTRGKTVVFSHTLVAWQGNAPAIGFYALILALLLAVWIRVSVVVVALFFTGDLPGEGGVLAQLAATPEGWVFMAAYVAAL